MAFFQNYTELEVLQRHTADLVSVIATDPSLFGDHVVQSGFAAPVTVNGIVNVLGMNDYQKGSRLLGLVDAKVRTAGTRENARKYFNDFLMIIAGPMKHREVAESLVTTFKSMDSSYASPLQRNQAPFTTGNQAPLTTGNQHSTSSGQRFDDNDHSAIFQKLSPRVKEWRKIGRGLGFSNEEMDTIEFTPMLLLRGPSGYLEQLLSQWLQWAPGDGRGSKGFATRESLIDGLLKVDLGGLAKQFGYIGTPTSQADSKPGNVAVSSGVSKEVIEMPPEYSDDEGHVGTDSGDIKDPNDFHFRWCVSPLRREHTKYLEPGYITGPQTSLASLKESNLWDVDELYVKFLNVIPSGWAFSCGGMNHHSVMALAAEWNKKGSHIPRIKEVPYGAPAHIRVCFTDKCTSQSYVGVQAEDIQPNRPTMWLNLSQGGDEYKKHLVVHEFGHALGLDHEHQRKDLWKLIKPYINLSVMKSDLKGVYTSYTADPKFKASDRRTTKYDPSSVMHYWFKESWLKAGYNTEDKVQNANLSPEKKAALLGILQRSKNTLVTEPSKEDLDFLEECYKKKKGSDIESNDGQGAHTDPPPMEEGPEQLPHAETRTPKPAHMELQPQPAKEKEVRQPLAENETAPHTENNPRYRSKDRGQNRSSSRDHNQRQSNSRSPYGRQGNGKSRSKSPYDGSRYRSRSPRRDRDYRRPSRSRTRSPYKRGGERGRSRERERESHRSKSRFLSHRRQRSRSRSRSPHRCQDSRRRSRSRSRSRYERQRERRKSRERETESRRSRSRSPGHFRRWKSRSRSHSPHQYQDSRHHSRSRSRSCHKRWRGRGKSREREIESHRSRSRSPGQFRRWKSRDSPRQYQDSRHHSRSRSQSPNLRHRERKRSREREREIRRSPQRSVSNSPEQTPPKSMKSRPRSSRKDRSPSRSPSPSPKHSSKKSKKKKKRRRKHRSPISSLSPSPERSPPPPSKRHKKQDRGNGKDKRHGRES